MIGIFIQQDKQKAEFKTLKKKKKSWDMVHFAPLYFFHLTPTCNILI